MPLPATGPCETSVHGALVALVLGEPATVPGEKEPKPAGKPRKNPALPVSLPGG